MSVKVFRGHYGRDERGTYPGISFIQDAEGKTFRVETDSLNYMDLTVDEAKEVLTLLADKLGVELTWPKVG